MKNNGIFLCSASKKVLFYDFLTKELEEICFVGVVGSRLMGIAREKDIIYFANHTHVFELGEDTARVVLGSNYPSQFHHMKIRDGVFLITATFDDYLYVCNTNNGIIRKVKIPKIKGKSNHLNSIFIEGSNSERLYYITSANSGIREKEDYSCVHVLDSNFDRLYEFEYGWEAHGFCIIKGKKYGLCNFWRYQPKAHPRVGGLLVDNVLKFKFREDEYFKDISADEHNIYISGGVASLRESRKLQDGILYILNYDMSIKDRVVLEKSGDLAGCLLNKYDFTN